MTEQKHFLLTEEDENENFAKYDQEYFEEFADVKKQEVKENIKTKTQIEEHQISNDTEYQFTLNGFYDDLGIQLILSDEVENKSEEKVDFEPLQECEDEGSDESEQEELESEIGIDLESNLYESHIEYEPLKKEKIFYPSFGGWRFIAGLVIMSLTLMGVVLFANLI